MDFVRVNATMPSKLLKQLDHYAEQMQEDRSTAIRQLLSKALVEVRKAKVLEAFRLHKLSLREAAEELGVDYWDLQELLEKEGIAVTDLTRGEVQESKELVDKLAFKR